MQALELVYFKPTSNISPEILEKSVNSNETFRGSYGIGYQVRRHEKTTFYIKFMTQ